MVIEISGLRLSEEILKFPKVIWGKRKLKEMSLRLVCKIPLKIDRS